VSARTDPSLCPLQIRPLHPPVRSSLDGHRSPVHYLRGDGGAWGSGAREPSLGAGRWAGTGGGGTTIPRGYSRAVSRGYSRAVSQGYSREVSRGYSRAVSQGYSREVPPSYSRAVSRGYSRAVPRGYSRAVSRGYSREVPPGLQQGRIPGLQQGRTPGLQQGRIPGLQQGRTPGPLPHPLGRRTAWDQLPRSAARSECGAEHWRGRPGELLQRRCPRGGSARRSWRAALTGAGEINACPRRM
jgi:hypothetical protein